MRINNTSHLIYPIKRSNTGTLFVGNTKFTLVRPKIANFNSAKTFKITNSQKLISVNISSFTVFDLTYTVGLNMRLSGHAVTEGCPLETNPSLF